jgi:hypothetical protein
LLQTVTPQSVQRQKTWPLPLALGNVVCSGLPCRSSTSDASMTALIAKAEPVSRWHHVQWQQCTMIGRTLRR